MDLPTKEIVNALKAVGKHVTGWQTDDGHVLVTALSKTRAAPALAAHHHLDVNSHFNAPCQQLEARSCLPRSRALAPEIGHSQLS